MEQESETSPLYSTIKRVGYRFVLATHVVFIIIAFTGAVILLAALLIDTIL